MIDIFDEGEDFGKGLNAREFRRPFNDASAILKAIGQRFIVYKDVHSDISNLRQYHSDWPAHIKQRRYLQDFQRSDPATWLNRLDHETNYWLVAATNNRSDHKHRVYDCRPSAIFDLQWMMPTFFIGSKKYEWLCYFDFAENRWNGQIYASASHPTPFDS